MESQGCSKTFREAKTWAASSKKFKRYYYSKELENDEANEEVQKGSWTNYSVSNIYLLCLAIRWFLLIEFILYTKVPINYSSIFSTSTICKISSVSNHSSNLDSWADSKAKVQSRSEQHQKSTVLCTKVSQNLNYHCFWDFSQIKVSVYVFFLLTYNILSFKWIKFMQ